MSMLDIMVNPGLRMHAKYISNANVKKDAAMVPPNPAGEVKKQKLLVDESSQAPLYFSKTHKIR